LREIVLDTETTGLDPRDNHRIIEVGCVELVNYIPTGTHWHWYINPQRDVPPEAVAVHGLTAQFLADKPAFDAIAGALLDAISGARLIIHNAAFDIKFLNAELERIGRPPITWDAVVDTLALARRKHPGASNTLDALCRRYGVDNSGRTKHGALLDSELLADVYLKLIGAEQAGLDLAVASSKEAMEAAQDFVARSRTLAPRLSGEEQAAHAELVAALGEKAVWRSYDGMGCAE
jgi:DNA polymerase-3 subunit epsilon